MNKQIKETVSSVLEEDLKKLVLKRKKLIDGNSQEEKIIKTNRIIRDTISAISEIQYLESDVKKNPIMICDLNFTDYNLQYMYDTDFKNYDIRDFYDRLVIKLDSAIELGVFLNSHDYRCIGKSTALAEKAIELNYFILYKTASRSRAMCYDELDFKNVVILSELIGLNKDRKYLVDEEFSEEEIIELRKTNNIVSGFIEVK